MSDSVTAVLRRSFTRVVTAMPVEVELPTGTVLHGQTRDLSMNGVLVRTPTQVLAVGDSGLAVRIILDPSTMIRANGRVVRLLTDADGAAVAITFLELDGAESYHHLRTLLLWNAPSQAAVADELDRHVGLH